MHKHTSIFLVKGLGWHLPGLLTSFHLNTASFYYLLDLSSFSLLSPLFLYLRFSHFFFFSSFFVVPSLFIPNANRQQLIRIFPSAADTQPCDGPPSRLYNFSVDIGVTDATKTSRLFCCHFNHMFHAFKILRSCCCVFSTHRRQANTSPAHPVSVRADLSSY